MPNWCQNVLIIECFDEQRALFCKKLFSLDERSQYYLDFGQLVPMPEALLKTTSTFNEHYKLLQMNVHKRFSAKLIKQFIKKSEQKRIRWLAKQCHWTIEHFVSWLEKRPNEQRILNFDVTLARQYVENLAQYGATDWYQWSLANWGCKWNANTDNCFIDIDDGRGIVCEFDTPWSPPEEWFATLCETFPNYQMRLAYFEPGMWFAGELIADTQGGYYSSPIEDDSEMKAFIFREFGWDFSEEEE